MTAIVTAQTAAIAEGPVVAPSVLRCSQRPHSPLDVGSTFRRPAGRTQDHTIHVQDLGSRIGPKANLADYGTMASPGFALPTR